MPLPLKPGESPEPAGPVCEVCGRQDCATLGYGNPAHKREHHENWARHWRLGCERLTAKLRAANAESASLRERLREVEGALRRLVAMAYDPDVTALEMEAVADAALSAQQPTPAEGGSQKGSGR